MGPYGFGSVAIALTTYVHFNLAWLLTRRTELQAELTRQTVAGAQFGLPGGRSRTGISYDLISQDLAAINYAIASQGGNAAAVVSETVADMSHPGP